MGAAVSFAGKHVLITGGSEGIGLALAECFLAEGSHLSLLARTESKLRNAEQQLKAKYPEGSVELVVADVTDYGTLKLAIDGVESGVGPIDVVICSAGLSIPMEFIDQKISDAEKVMRVNYFGSYYVAKLVVPRMLERGSGHISFVSSMAACAPIAGYSGYAPTKYAVRALSDCLRAELVGTGVSVSISYPPDTATPGFAKEEETKPGCTRKISETFSDDVYTPDRVAALIVKGMKSRKYHLPNPDLLHSLGISLMAGVTPKPKWLVVEMLLAPLLVLVSQIVRLMQDRIVAKYNQAKAAAS